MWYNLLTWYSTCFTEIFCQNWSCPYITLCRLCILHLWIFQLSATLFKYRYIEMYKVCLTIFWICICVEFDLCYILNLCVLLSFMRRISGWLSSHEIFIFKFCFWKCVDYSTNDLSQHFTCLFLWDNLDGKFVSHSYILIVHKMDIHKRHSVIYGKAMS